jgi:hypothetical protein
MNTYRIVYTSNDDLQRCFIDADANDRKTAIEWLQNTGRKIGLSHKIVSCRSAKNKNNLNLGVVS